MDVEARLDKIETKLDGIAETLKVVAVQHEQIGNLQVQMSSLWEKYDALVGPKGTIPEISNFQASCPRKQIKFMWYLIVPISLALLGVAYKLVAG